MSSYRPADTGENTFLSTIISQTSSGHLRARKYNFLNFYGSLRARLKFNFAAFKKNGLLSREHIADVNLNDTSVYMEIN